MAGHPKFRIPDLPKNRPNVPRVVELLRFYYRQPGNGVGGNLHIITEDENINRHHIEFCKMQAKLKNDIWGEHIADLMLRMTSTQLRRVVINNYDNYR